MTPSPVIDPTTGEVLGVTGGETDELTTVDVERLRQLAYAYRSQAQGLMRDVEGLERDVRSKNRKLKALEDELKEQRMEAPEAQTVRAIFNAWVQATGRNPKVTKLGPAREKAILARLREGQSAERILRAVTIGVRGANVSNRDAEREALIRAMHEAVERLPDGDAVDLRNIYKETLGNVKVYDDIELVCRNEVNLERFADMADKFAPFVAPPGA